MDYTAIFTYFEDAAKTGRWGSLYDPKNTSGYSFIARLQKAIDLAPSFKHKTILDLGCGTGVLVPFVIDNGGRYIGIDTSSGMLMEIKRTYPEYINNENVTFVFGDVRKNPLPGNVDIMIGLGFIEYFDNPGELTQKLYDTLVVGGRLILSFPNSCSLDYLSVQLLAPFRYLARIILGKSTPQPPRRLWTLKNAKRLYSTVGFKNLKNVNYNTNIVPYPITKIFPSFNNFLAKKFEHSPFSKYGFFATGFLISGEK